MKKNRILTAMLLLFYLSSFNLNAQNEKFKALFLYNFIKNIEWPESYKQGDLVIGVFGNSPIAKELETIANTQKNGSQNLKIKVFTNADELIKCHLIFVCPSKSGSISQIISKIGSNSTLVVSDTRGGIQQGAAINFISDGDKLKFEISKSHIEQKGLKVSASLLNLGISSN